MNALNIRLRKKSCGSPMIRMLTPDIRQCFAVDAGRQVKPAA
jgi:hypothetical protein